MGKTLWILGASGHAREIEAIARSMDKSSRSWSVYRQINQTQEVILPAGADVVLGMGSPAARARAMQLPRDVCWPTLTHGSAHVGPRVDLGAGVVVAPACTLTTDITLEEGVMLNTAAAIAHDVRIGAYCLINPRVTISGGVMVGEGVLIGAGAVVLEGRTIGPGAVVGAGAVVTKDVPGGTTVVGVPARPIKGSAA